MTKLLLVMVVLGFSGSAFAEVGQDPKINCADVVKAAKVKSKSEAKAEDKEKPAEDTKAAKTE